MATNKPTLSLHPDVLSNAIRINPNNAGYLAPATQALEYAYQSLSAIHQAREKAASNPAWTDAQKILNTAQLADRYFEKTLQNFDSARERLDSLIGAIENQLKKIGYETHPRHATEIRAHLKSLGKQKGRQLMLEAIENKDVETIFSALGAPHYLSGFTKEDFADFRAKYQKQYHPELIQRLEQAKKAVDLVNMGAGLIFAEFEKAIGANFDQVKKIKAANSEAEAALVVKSFEDGSFKQSDL